jgi:GntR family transcriptional regulator
MLEVKVDRGDPTPLHAQVASQIRRSIAEGDAKPGDRIPPAKDLAAVMHVNVNTVLRALRELRDEGLLDFRRGLGVRVAGTPEQGIVLSKTRELIGLARRNGYRPDELIALIRSLT